MVIHRRDGLNTKMYSFVCESRIKIVLANLGNRCFGYYVKSPEKSKHRYALVGNWFVGSPLTYL